MVYAPHIVEKAEKVANTIVGLVEAEVSLPRLVTRGSIDVFRGAAGDKITHRVEGRLPYRRFAFRNDRTNPLIADVYKEGKVDVTWGDRLYSEVDLIDEQLDFDLEGGWTKIANKQAAAVAQGIQDEVAAAIEAAPYNFTVGLDGADAPGDIRAALFELRKVFNKLRVPDSERFLAVGANVEMAILLDKDLLVASSVGAERAEDALTNATIGRVAGFQVILDQTIDPDSAYAFVPSAFVLYTGAPVLPRSAPFATTVNYAGFSLRMVQDYDIKYLTDRSVVDTYVGVAPVKDLFFKKSVYTASATPVTLEPATDEFFVRGVKFSLTAASSYPAVGSALALETGIDSTDAFVAPSQVP